VGKTKAIELLLTGNPMGSEKALRIGLINAVLPDEIFSEDTLEIAKKIAQKSLPAIQGILESVIHGMERSLRMGWYGNLSSLRN
jgi:enoyl-CoA hydratase/carnithine racemase